MRPATTATVTSEEANLQVGFVVYPTGGVVQRHSHRPIARHIVGTSEVLIVRQGRCIVELFDDERHPVTRRELRAGDVIVLTGGGHGFSMLEDTVPTGGQAGSLHRTGREGALLSTRIPVNEPLFGEREVEYVTECVRSGWVSSAGRFIAEFEDGWAAYCDRKYGIAVKGRHVAGSSGMP